MLLKSVTCLFNSDQHRSKNRRSRTLSVSQASIKYNVLCNKRDISTIWIDESKIYLMRASLDVHIDQFNQYQIKGVALQQGGPGVIFDSVTLN